VPARALEVWGELAARHAAGGEPPDRIGYTTAINAAGLALQLDRAFELFKELRAMPGAKAQVGSEVYVCASSLALRSCFVCARKPA
jgi:hypothetical protein